ALDQQALQRGRLRNFSTHLGAVPSHAFGGVKLRDGLIVVPIPDPPPEPIYLWDEFTYEAGDELRAFANRSLAAVGRFVEGMLTALEEERDRIEEERNLGEQ